MATRTEPMRIHSLSCATQRWLDDDRRPAAFCGFSAPGGYARTGNARAGHGRSGLGARLALGGNELVKPADFALDRFEPVPLEFKGVAVYSLAGPGRRGPEPLKALLQPAAAALENPHPDIGLSQAEEREVDAEAVVLPGRRTRLGQQILESLLAFRGEPVDDLGSSWPVQRPDGRVRDFLRDQAVGQQVLQGRIQRAIAEGAESTQQRVEPLAQLVPVHGGLVQDAEDGKFEHPRSLAAHTRPVLLFHTQLTSWTTNALVSAMCQFDVST